MFEKFANAAEQAATSASRRDFLGSVGKAAMGLSGAIGAVLLLPEAAHAGEKKCRECIYTCADGRKTAIVGVRKCPATNAGCNLTSEVKINCGF
jgi:hypothetical protein